MRVTTEDGEGSEGDIKKKSNKKKRDDKSCPLNQMSGSALQGSQRRNRQLDQY